MLKRDPANPLLSACTHSAWELAAAFNPCVARVQGTCHLVYRAQSEVVERHGARLSLSSIGHAQGHDGVHFGQRRVLVQPEQPWERYGCEDPRLTWFEGRGCIFYTCLSTWPFEARGIRLAVALTDDFRRVEKHPVTPFNAKAMVLFPERVGGRVAALLTVHTDMPPAKVALVTVDRIEELWSQEMWSRWYARLDEHVVPLLRSPADHVEVGAPPLRTPQGWLLVYSYIRDYFGPGRHFAVEAALLDADDPRRVRGRRTAPLLQPEADYELQGSVPNVVFPSGALIDGDRLSVYYGAADTHCCVAHGELPPLMAELTRREPERFVTSAQLSQGFQRFSGNPILVPRPELRWEARACFNPGALLIDGTVHLVYRAMALDGTSTFGHATSRDGVHIDERSARPVFEPEQPFEVKLRPGNSGCEDPRLTLLDGVVYLFYTGYDGYVPRVAFTSLPLDDFLARRWHWPPGRVLTPPGLDDKDGGLLPRRLGGDFVVFHRFGGHIRVNRCRDLEFGDGRWLNHDSSVIQPRLERWDNHKFGIAAPPLDTPHGWLLLYHRVTRPDSVYKVEAMLLQHDDPAHVLADTSASVLEPETEHERVGQTPKVVFPCGAVVRGGDVWLYYGAADSVVCVARMSLAALYRRLGL